MERSELEDAVSHGQLVPLQPGLTIHMKRPYPPMAMMQVFDHEVATYGPHACDGVVLVPNVSHTDMLRKFPELKAKFCHTIDFVFRLQIIKYKGSVKQHINMLYTLGSELQDAHILLPIGPDHVAVKMENNDAFKEWRTKNAAGLRTGDVVENVIECRCVLTKLSPAKARTWDRWDGERIHQMRNERWQDGTRNNEQLLIKPRHFKFLLTVSFIKVRADKTYPNTLRTIVSTLVQSNNMPMHKVAKELESLAMRTIIREERSRGI